MAMFVFTRGIFWVLILQVVCAQTNDFWAAHILDEYFTGPANKDMGNMACDVGFISFYCFGQQKAFSDYNSEEHVDGTVFEFVRVHVSTWGQYLSCCPPASKTNTGAAYRCNTWTNENNDNCHTLNLPWNDGKVKAVGAQVPAGSKPVGGQTQWMWSFPSEGEGNAWWQGFARRIHMHDLGTFWANQAGGCPQCIGLDLENPCYGSCINGKLSTQQLIDLTNQAFGDKTHFPDFGIPNCEGIQFAGTNKCIDLPGGDSSYGSPIDIWDCNGMVNQAWYWEKGTYNIQIGGHNLPGMCIDLPRGNAANGVKLQLWGCNNQNSQKWVWDAATSSIKYGANTNFCIDVPGANAQNGNQLWLWQCTGGSSQKWSIYTRSEEGKRALASSKPSRKKPLVQRSWMHEYKDFLSKTNGNVSLPDGFIPWHERPEIKEWYAALMPGPSLPRPLVPSNWTGYNTSDPGYVYV